MKKLLCGILVLLMVCTAGCGEEVQTPGETTAPATEQTQTLTDPQPTEPQAPERSQLRFAHIEYTRPDVEAALAAQQTCITLAQGQDFEQLSAAVSDYLKKRDSVSTMTQLARLSFYKDTTNTQWDEEFNHCSEGMVSILSKEKEMLCALADSQFADQLEETHFTKDYLKRCKGKGAQISEELEALLLEESELQNRFYSITSLADGEALLIELVKLRHKIAAAAGYDSYAAYSYAENNDRDFTTEDAKMFLEETRNELAPLHRQVITGYEKDPPKCSTEEALAYVKGIADKAGGTIADAYALMMDGGFYDIDVSLYKMDGALCTNLDSYQVPFIYMNPRYGNAAIDLTHEFGHFCQLYAGYGIIPNADTLEVFSQAMEYLSLSYADDQWDQYRIKGMLKQYISTAANADFELRLYELPEDQLTVENIRELYTRVGKEWDVAYTGVAGANYAGILHFYLAPMYTLSYSVSSDVALQIYAMELQEPGAGIACFQACIATQQTRLLDFIREAGLQSPFAPGRGKTTRGSFEKALEQCG